jgi:hypothetical protein
MLVGKYIPNLIAKPFDVNYLRSNFLAKLDKVPRGRSYATSTL